MVNDADRAVVNAGRDAEQNHAVLCAEFCRRLFHDLVPPPVLGKGEGKSLLVPLGGRLGDLRARRGDRGSSLAQARKQSQGVIIGGVSLEAAPPACHDDAETASIIVNGCKGLYEHGHRDAFPVGVAARALP